MARSFPFYIIGYSHSMRREEYIKEFEAYDIIDFEDDSLLSKELVTNHDFKVGAAKKLIIQSAILDFFKKNNLPYVTTDHIPELHEDLAMIKRKSPSLYSYVHNDPNKLIDFGKLVKDLAPLPCGHYGYKAQFIIAEYTFREIIKRYPDVNVVQHPFVTLQEYHNMFPYTGPKHINNDWL